MHYLKMLKMIWFFYFFCKHALSGDRNLGAAENIQKHTDRLLSNFLLSLFMLVIVWWLKVGSEYSIFNNSRTLVAHNSMLQTVKACLIESVTLAEQRSTAVPIDFSD